MSDDYDLVKRLESGFDRAEKIKISGLEHDRRCLIAASRIRELEAQLEEADRNAKRLEALVEKVVAWDGKPTTHVIVPVKSTEAMNKAAHEAYCDALTNREAVSVSELISVVYAAMIRAAQGEGP